MDAFANCAAMRNLATQAAAQVTAKPLERDLGPEAVKGSDLEAREVRGLDPGAGAV
jgi:hypothetical protein